MPTVTALCVTHERPQWIPWLYERLREQATETLFKVRAVLVDSSEVCAPANELVTVVHVPGLQSIPAKRNLALKEAEHWRSDYIAWFDDDDWSHPRRLAEGVEALERNPLCWGYGNTRASMVDARKLVSFEHRSAEPLIFNGAVYRLGGPVRFNEHLPVGEDTDWNHRMLGERSYIVTNSPLHAWLCHGSNITNRADKLMFGHPFPSNLSRFRSTFEQNPERRK